MYHIEVSTNASQDILIKQEFNDMNEPDPIITISKEQAGLVASWILDAAEHESDHMQEDLPVMVNYYSRGPEIESEELTIFNNSRGMIVLKIDDDNFIEMSPQMGKRMRELLTKAISTSIGSMFLADDEV
ncbi:hypothetical protein HRH59_02420 [Rheinheimera sp. YQF-2]|uniref:Uncharacterized protein n=1 Tax=Rheinheimera lutimaris TaxID=2740584 RepID=A0A7Y5EJT9_9GAMM|nr:hypothetical protein [Rheinheimera lutimaris]NRQ41428.1 hypothetical protein [Rheinheimera lutimaris]